MPQRVLIVDDEKIVRSTFTKLLQKEKYDVKAVSSGEDALEAIEEEEFKITLLDIGLPGITGIDVLKRLKKQKPKLIVIIITAFGYDEELIAETKRIGCDGYIGKNMPVSQIIDNFRMFVRVGKEKRLKEE